MIIIFMWLLESIIVERSILVNSSTTAKSSDDIANKVGTAEQWLSDQCGEIQLEVS
jgi:hypothetical protein